jgi:hypothetical protein
MECSTLVSLLPVATRHGVTLWRVAEHPLEEPPYRSSAIEIVEQLRYFVLHFADQADISP